MMLCTPRSYTSWRRTFPWGESSSAWAGPILPVPSQQPRRCWTPFRTSRRQKARALSAATTSRKEAAACGCRVATIFTVHASHPGSAATPPAQPAVQRWAMRHLPRLALRPNLTPPAQRQRPRSPLLPTTSSRRYLHGFGICLHFVAKMPSANRRRRARRGLKPAAARAAALAAYHTATCDNARRADTGQQ